MKKYAERWIGLYGNSETRSQTKVEDQQSLIPIYLCVLVSAIGYGVSFPLLSISLEAMGVSGKLIGLNAAMPALGWLIGSIFLPRTLTKIDIKSAMQLCLGISAASIVTFTVTKELVFWMVLRFLFGGALGMFYRVVENWINEVSNDSTRGTILGVYSVFFMLGLAIGSSVQPFLGIDDYVPYISISLIILVAMGMLFLSSIEMPQITSSPISVFQLTIVFTLPVAMIGIFAYGLFEDIPAYLMSVYAIKNGLGEEIAAVTLTAAAIGNLIFPVPIGYLSDRINRNVVLIVSAVLVVILSGVIPMTLSNPTLFLVTLILWSGLAGGVYCVALSIVGDRFRGAELVGANATFGIVYAFGALIGPLLNGMAVDQLNSQGLVVSAGFIYGAFAILAIWYCRMRGGA